MKTRFLLICLSLFLAVLPRSQAQDESLSSPVRSQEELDQLFGPIALYPDALIALILPASTVPSDVVMAARYLRSSNDPTRTDGQSWDDSVKSLSHYPEVVKWMDENLAWTKQAGEAFVAQPADVMNAIQRLRAAARAAGTLVDTPQQSVVMEGDDITIVPADPEVIYVPRYDPEVVYISRPGYYHDPFLTFGVGFSTGVWLGYDFDWGRHRLWSIDRRDRERYWRERREHDWHGSPRVGPGPGHPRIVDDNHFRHQEWHPRPDAHRPTHVSGGVVRTDSNRPDNSSRRTPDQKNDGHRNEADHKTDDHRWQHGPDNSNDNGRGRPSSNNATAPAAVNSNGNPSSQQPARTGPVAAPPATSPAVSSQPAQTAPRQDRHDRGEREARGNDRSIRTQNPQGRVMQPQAPAQTRQADNKPTFVNREARASEPSPQRVRTVESSQPRAPQTVVNTLQPRASPPPAARQDSSSSNDRKDRDDRRDRSQR
jgi:hypothetical protein